MDEKRLTIKGYNYHRCDFMEDGIHEMANKLRTYEDLEERGLLQKLPCKVGDTVYAISYTLECDCDYDCKEYDAYKCEEDICCEHEYKVYKVKETEFQIQILAVLGKTVFLTKAEAEKAMEEMKEGGANDSTRSN